MSEYGSFANAIDGAIEKALREKRLVGAVVLVAQGGEIVYRRAAGMADREAGKPMACNTLFRLASVSKPIVSTAALALMARGDMRLDDPVTRWLPDFRPRLADGTVPLLTLRHLMTHTAGLSYRFFSRKTDATHDWASPTGWMRRRSACRKMCGALLPRRCWHRPARSGVIPSPPMCWARLLNGRAACRWRRRSKNG